MGRPVTIRNSGPTHVTDRLPIVIRTLPSSLFSPFLSLPTLRSKTRYSIGYLRFPSPFGHPLSPSANFLCLTLIMADMTAVGEEKLSPGHDDLQQPGTGPDNRGTKRGRMSAEDDDDDDDKPGRERRKIEIKFIQDKSRRHITFSKRKAGIMKKVLCSPHPPPSPHERVGRSTPPLQPKTSTVSHANADRSILGL